MTETVLLILAAGQSSRFGSDKRLARLPDGRSFLQRSIDLALATGLDCRVVLAPGDALATGGADVLMAQRARRGMGATIADAIGQLPEDYRSCLLLPVDMPLLQVSTVACVADAAVADNIVVPVADGRRGHPVAFGRHFWPLLAVLDGDRGGRGILQHCHGSVLEVAVGDPGCYRDVDTPEDYLRVVGKEGARGQGPGAWDV